MLLRGLRGALVASLCFALGIHLELIPRTVALNLYCVVLSQAIYIQSALAVRI